MREVFRSFVGFVLILLVSISMARATEKEKDAKLEEIVVTATRTEKEAKDIPAAVSVITKEDIEKRNVQTIDRALNATVGVFNRSFKGVINIEPTVILRGFPGSQRTLILINGTPFNGPYVGSAPFGGMSAEDIEQIEVVKGPFSSLYGGYAMGGVVNFITKLPEKKEFIIKSGYGSSWDRGEGIDDLRKLYVSYGDRVKDQLSLFLSYGYKATNGYPPNLNVQSKQPTAGIDGWDLTKDYKGDSRYLIGDTGDNRWWDDNITFRVGYDFSRVSKINLLFMRTRNEYNFDDPHTYLRDSNGNAVWSYGTVKESSFLSGSGSREQNVYQLSYATEISNINMKLSVGLNDYDKYWYIVPDATVNRSGGTGKITSIPSESYNADMQFTAALFNRHILTFGGSFRHGWSDAEENKLGDWKDEEAKTALVYQSKGRERNYAIFLQDEITILSNLTAYVGIRQDWWKSYNGYANQAGTVGYPITYGSRDASSFSPKTSIVYKPLDTTTLRASIGRAYRPPTIYELYRTTTSSSGITTAGNPGLKPETTLSWEIGAHQELWVGAHAGMTYFENNVDDLIYSKTVTPTLVERINVGKAKIKGVEIEAEQRIEKGLRLFANFTYNNAKIVENKAKPETVGKKLTEVPERMFNIGGEYEKGPFSTSLIGRYVSKRYRDDENNDTTNNVYTSRDPYFVTDAKISYALTKWSTLSLSIDNIFDRQYFDYYKTPGRSWFGELTMRF